MFVSLEDKGGDLCHKLHSPYVERLPFKTEKHSFDFIFMCCIETAHVMIMGFCAFLCSGFYYVLQLIL